MFKLYNIDCISYLSTYSPFINKQLKLFDLIVADPPYNLGIKYDLYNDKKNITEYRKWCKEWISLCCESSILNKYGSIYIICPDEHAGFFQTYLEESGMHFRNWIKWYETFGSNCTKKFNRTSRNILYYTKHKTRFTFNPILVPSARQSIYKDKRAKSGGKLYDDVWTIPRLCGTFKERVNVPTQIPLEIPKRIILTSTNEGHLILDPFCGSGTFGVVAKQYNRQFIGLDISYNYLQIAEQRIKNAKIKI